MKFKAEIYQLDKSGDEVTYRHFLKGDIDGLDKVDGAKVGEYFAKKLFLVKSKQDKHIENGGKARFFGLASTKPLYFYIEVFNDEGERTTLLNSQLEGITCKSIKLQDATPELVSSAISNLYEVVNDTTVLA